MATKVVNPSMTHTQSVASDVWEIDHGLNTLQPAINVWIPVNGVYTAILPAEVRVIDSNHLRVTFSAPQVGSAVVN